MWVDSEVVTIPLFWVDVPAASESVGFGTKLSGAEPDYEVELGEELRPPGLSACEELRSSKVLQILVVGDHVNRSSGALQVVPPGLERLEDSEEFFVVGVVIEFRLMKRTQKECDGADLRVWTNDAKNCCNSII